MGGNRGRGQETWIQDGYSCFPWSIFTWARPTSKWHTNAMADLRNTIRGRRALGSKFFHFNTVFGKIWQNLMFAPPTGGLAPHLWETLDPPLKYMGVGRGSSKSWELGDTKRLYNTNLTTSTSKSQITCKIPKSYDQMCRQTCQLLSYVLVPHTSNDLCRFLNRV